MDQHQEQNALSRVVLAEKTAVLTAASTSFDALDAEAPNLSSSERYDLAFGIFAAFKTWLVDFEIETGVHLTDDEFAGVWLRTVPHVTEQIACDLLAERFAEDQHLRLPNGFHVNWHAANDEAVIAAPGLTLVISGHPVAQLLKERAS
jgi:hypothetical protein